MRKTDLAYAAGVIDGEGCIGLYPRPKKEKNYLMRVEVGCTNEWLIEWLKSTFGGSTRFQPASKSKNWKPQWRWMVAAQKALVFLKLVYPYLRLKKPQAEIAIKFQESKRKGRKPLSDKERSVMDSQKATMASLNKRGVS